MGGELGIGDIIGRIIIGTLLGLFSLFAIIGLFLNRDKKQAEESSPNYILGEGDEDEKEDE